MRDLNLGACIPMVWLSQGAKTMNQGQSVFAQLIQMLPRQALVNAVKRYDGDRKTTRLPCRQQLLVMLMAQFLMRSSLRDAVSSINSLGSAGYHSGIKSRISRSTLADANSRRDWRIFFWIPPWQWCSRTLLWRPPIRN